MQSKNSDSEKYIWQILVDLCHAFDRHLTCIIPDQERKGAQKNSFWETAQSKIAHSPADFLADPPHREVNLAPVCFSSFSFAFLLVFRHLCCWLSRTDAQRWDSSRHRQATAVSVSWSYYWPTSRCTSPAWPTLCVPSQSEQTQGRKK